MEKLVINGSMPGGLVYDPYMGTGTTGVAALTHGRRFLGIEKDEKHFETACRRIQETVDEMDRITDQRRD